jgi:hypothetical protein
MMIDIARGDGECEKGHLIESAEGERPNSGNLEK